MNDKGINADTIKQGSGVRNETTNAQCKIEREQEKVMLQQKRLAASCGRKGLQCCSNGVKVQAWVVAE